MPSGDGPRRASYRTGGSHDKMVQDAVFRNLEVIGGGLHLAH
jgi:hypothetical protein